MWKNFHIGNMKNLRDPITKMGEKSPPKILTDFLLCTLTKTTHLGVLETIESLALGPKPGPQEDDFNSRPEFSDFDHFDKMLSSSKGLRVKNST